MKYFGFILAILLFCIGCNTSKDKAFEELYFKNVAIIEKYGIESIEGCCTQQMNDIFWTTCEYMRYITDIDYSFYCYDFHFYETKDSLEKDIKYLKEWYRKYGKNMTKEEANAIVGSVYEENYRQHEEIVSQSDFLVQREKEFNIKYPRKMPDQDSVIAQWENIDFQKIEEEALLFWEEEKGYMKEAIRLSKQNNESLDSAIIKWSYPEDPFFITADTIIKWWNMFPE